MPFLSEIELCWKYSVKHAAVQTARHLSGKFLRQARMIEWEPPDGQQRLILDRTQVLEPERRLAVLFMMIRHPFGSAAE